MALDPSTEDIYTLTNGYVVTRLEKRTGAPVWSWSGQDQSSLTTFTHLLATSDTVYAIGLSSSFASYTLHIASFSAATGEVISASEIPSSIASPADVLAFAKDTPVVSWLEHGKVKYLPLTSTLQDKKARASSHGPFDELVDVGLSGALIGRHKQESTVLTFDGSKFASAKSLGEHDATAKSAASSVNGKRYVAKSEGPIIEVTGIDSDESAILFPYDADDTLSHYAIHTSSVGVPQVLVITGSGAIQLFVNGELKWSREEGLTTATLAEFVELPERISTEGEATRDEPFIHRLQRHAVLAQVRLSVELKSPGLASHVQSPRRTSHIISRTSYSGSLQDLTPLPHPRLLLRQTALSLGMPLDSDRSSSLPLPSGKFMDLTLAMGRSSGRIRSEVGSFPPSYSQSGR